MWVPYGLTQLINLKEFLETQVSIMEASTSFSKGKQ